MSRGSAMEHQQYMPGVVVRNKTGESAGGVCT